MDENEGLRGFVVLLRVSGRPRCMLTAVSGGLSKLGTFMYGFVGVFVKLGFAILNSGATMLMVVWVKEAMLPSHPITHLFSSEVFIHAIILQ